MSNVTPIKKNVSFSKYSSMALIDQPTQEEKADLFYNRQDNEIFRQVMLCESALCGGLIRMKIMNGELLTGDDMIGCVGLESFVARHVSKDVAQKKRAHILSVLEEYNRQVRVGYYDAEELARISGITSFELKARSHKIALGAMHLGD